MDVGPLFISDAQALKLIQPRERPFYHPSSLAQSTAVFSVTFCEARYDVVGNEELAGLPPRHNHGRLTRHQGGGADVLAFPANVGLPNKCNCLLRVVTIGPG